MSGQGQTTLALRLCSFQPTGLSTRGSVPMPSTSYPVLLRSHAPTPSPHLEALLALNCPLALHTPKSTACPVLMPGPEVSRRLGGASGCSGHLHWYTRPYTWEGRVPQPCATSPLQPTPDLTMPSTPAHKYLF